MKYTPVLTGFLASRIKSLCWKFPKVAHEILIIYKTRGGKITTRQDRTENPDVTYIKLGDLGENST